MTRKFFLSLGLPVLALSFIGSPVLAQKVTYVLPAPYPLPSFMFLYAAEGKGFFKDQGISIKFVVGKGGVDAVKQVGAGNAEFGGGLGDSPIIVRPQGVPVKGVALMGDGALHFIAARKDLGVNTLKDLKGKQIAVMTYADTSYFVLLAILAKLGIKKQDVTINAYGPGGMIKAVMTGKAVALFNPPFFGASVQAKYPTLWVQATKFFPSFAQAVVTSDKMIKGKSNLVRKFVLASLKGMKYTMDHPEEVKQIYIGRNPTWKKPARRKVLDTVVEKYVKEIYPGQKVLGEMDLDRLREVQDYYLKVKVIRKKSKLTDLFDNSFVRQVASEISR